MKLHLHVKASYFAEIKAGTKTEEYREQTRYWQRRLTHPVANSTEIVRREYEGIVIYNAYKAGPENRIEFPWRGFTYQVINHHHFGNRNTQVFAIKLQTHEALAREITARNIAALKATP
jgi:hypothetical protein